MNMTLLILIIIMYLLYSVPSNNYSGALYDYSYFVTPMCP